MIIVSAAATAAATTLRGLRLRVPISVILLLTFGVTLNQAAQGKVRLTQIAQLLQLLPDAVVCAETFGLSLTYNFLDSCI